MILNYLTPVSLNDLEYYDSLSLTSIGKNLEFVDNTEDLFISDIKLALIFVSENRCCNSCNENYSDLKNIREQFYKLQKGNWNLKITDLGDLRLGHEIKDSFFALTELVSELIKNNITPIVIGGSQALTYSIYRAYDSLEQSVNLVSVDSKFDIGSQEASINSDNYLSHIILTQPTNLFNFSNLSYQTYFNSQEEIDLMDKLYFDALRLGQVNGDIYSVEPILRDADILSFDLSSIRMSDSPASTSKSPNGLYGEQACAISRYAGLSDKISSFGIFEYDSSIDSNLQSAQLLSQIIWYFIEGYSVRANDYPFCSKENYFKYIVPIEGNDLYFYKSNKSDRWWLDVPYPDGKSEKIVRHALIPCSYEDYLKATEQEIPDRYWKAYRKLL